MNKFKHKSYKALKIILTISEIIISINLLNKNNNHNN